jgi:hypothetical protein
LIIMIDAIVEKLRKQIDVSFSVISSQINLHSIQEHVKSGV